MDLQLRTLLRDLALRGPEARAPVIRAVLRARGASSPVAPRQQSYGYGNGDGNGYGDGYGDGDGNGYGNGNGDGDGNGYGNGNGNGDG